MSKRLRRLFVVGYDDLVVNMFVNHKHDDYQYVITKDITDADLVQFLGGEDVNPEYYGQYRHRTTFINAKRDEEELAIYDLALQLGLPMTGICRGGQFLHVMNGGSMFQNVDNHSGTHQASIYGKLIPITVSSTHHQMMKLDPHIQHDAMILMYAEESTTKEFMSDTAAGHAYSCSRHVSKNYPDPDLEAIYYPKTNCLCYQPHPEYATHDNSPIVACREVYFHFIDNYLFGDGEEPAQEDVKDDEIPFDLANDIALAISKEIETIGCDCH